MKYLYKNYAFGSSFKKIKWTRHILANIFSSIWAQSRWNCCSWLHHEHWTRAINKIKAEIYHWQGKMKQQEQNSHCFLSQPQLCAHTLLAHYHLSLSQALASSPTAPTRPRQHMPLPNIHLLPAGLLRVWSGPVIETCLDFTALFALRTGEYMWFGQLHKRTRSQKHTHNARN